MNTMDLGQAIRVSCMPPIDCVYFCIERGLCVCVCVLKTGGFTLRNLTVVFLCLSVSTAPQLKPVSTTDVSMKLEQHTLTHTL